jgi:hypothetical protein
VVVGLLVVAGGVGGAAGPAAPTVVGSWRLTITQIAAAGEASNPSLATFFADGGLMVDDVPARPAPAGLDATAILGSGAHGAWVESGDGVAFTFVNLATTDDGTFLGTGTVSATGALDPSGNVLSGTYAYGAAGPGGEPLGAGSGTFEGERIAVATS